MKRLQGASIYILAVLMVAASIPFAAQALAQQRGGQSGWGRAEPRGRNGDGNRRNRSYTDEDLRPRAERLLREIESLEAQCLDAVNRERQTRGLEPLEFSRELLPVARDYSRWMAEEKFFSHTDPQGRSVRQRVNDAGIKWRALGENLAYANGYINPVAASMSGWMESPGHRRNILDRAFRKTAIGVWIADDETVYFTEIFMK